MPAPGQSPYAELFKALDVTPKVADGDYVKVEIIDGEPVFSIVTRSEMQRSDVLQFLGRQPIGFPRATSFRIIPLE